MTTENLKIEITGAGYEKLKRQKDLFFTIPYRTTGALTFADESIDIIAESREDAIKWLKAKHPNVRWEN